MPDGFDPLEDIARFPTETQIAIVVSVLRSQAKALDAVQSAVANVNRALWGLVVALIAVAATLLAGHIH